MKFYLKFIFNVHSFPATGAFGFSASLNFFFNSADYSASYFFKDLFLNFLGVVLYYTGVSLKEASSLLNNI
jgi:hypothetical protein